MSKKDYIAIAAIIESFKTSYGFTDYPSEFERLKSDFANYLESQNPRFNRVKFLEACGVCE